MFSKERKNLKSNNLNKESNQANMLELEEKIKNLDKVRLTFDLESHRANSTTTVSSQILI